MEAFAHPDQRRHAPRFFLMRGAVRANYEVPERADALLAGLGRLGLAPAVPPLPGRAVLETVHAPDYLDFLAAAAGAGNPAEHRGFRQFGQAGDGNSGAEREGRGGVMIWLQHGHFIEF